MKKYKEFVNESLGKPLEIVPEINNELNWYKQVYDRRWDERLEEDFIKIIKGYPIRICEYNDRNDVREEIVLPLKNQDGKIFYKAYVTPEVIQQNPMKYDFVSPIFRNKDTLDWVIQKIDKVENLDNNALGGMNVHISKECGGGGTSLAYLFLVNYRRP